MISTVVSEPEIFQFPYLVSRKPSLLTVLTVLSGRLTHKALNSLSASTSPIPKNT